MSKLKKSSSHSLKSYLNPLGNPERVKSTHVDCGGSALPMHLCHSSSVQCDVVDVLKENVFRGASPGMRKCKSQRQHTDTGLKPESLVPLSQHNRAPLSASKKQNKNAEAENVQCGDIGGEIPLFCATPNHRLYVWDEEAAPASAWSTLGNRALLLRPLPLDVGRCRCYIVREHRDGPQKPSVYTLYTDEGQGRQDRMLAVARHRRRVGRSEFVIAQSSMEDGYLGTLTANLVGTRYHIWDQGDLLTSDQKSLQGVVMFEPTVTTLTGDSRKMRVFVPKYQSMQINDSGFQLGHGLPKDWEENMGLVAELVSKTPRYNRVLKRYELDFRETARLGCRIKSSVKNFQLTMEEHGKQVSLLLGKLSKSTYVMEFCFPLTGYQAFSICLASMDSKLCCTM